MTEVFPPRKRRQSPTGSSSMLVVSPNFSSPPDRKRMRLLLQSLLLLSREICSSQPHGWFLLKRYTSSIIRKSRLLSLVFEELLHAAVIFPPAGLVCMEELYMLLGRFKTLVEDCCCCCTSAAPALDNNDHAVSDNHRSSCRRSSSKMWLLLNTQSISLSFYDLNLELSTLLDIFPAHELILDLCPDVQDLIALLRKQNERPHPHPEEEEEEDQEDSLLRAQVLDTLDSIHRQIIPDPSHLAHIFHTLGLSDSNSCSHEIDLLHLHHPSAADGNSSSTPNVAALIGLVRYAKCVLYGASSSASTPAPPNLNPTNDDFLFNNIPPDFRCPISLDLMRDPVVVSTGQTYDRASITSWVESGHNTCPKTGQTLARADLIPNRALHNLIATWCRQQRIPLPFHLTTAANPKTSPSPALNRTAMEATKMTVSFLLTELTAPSQSVEMANSLVHELRVLAKADPASRACIAEAGAMPLLLRFLGPEQSSLQVNAVTTILNLSILEANKAMIMETEGVLNGVIEVLRSGATWEAKGNAAATIFSLTGVHAYRKKLGRKARVAKGLVDLARDGPGGGRCKRDAMAAILNIAGDREGAGKLIEAGVVDMVREVMGRMPEEGVSILEAVVKKGRMTAVAAAYHVVEQLAVVLREGSDTGRESAAATLVNMCRKGGSEMVGAIAAVEGVERVIWEVMGMGTGRGRRKAATLLRILRRWAAGLEEEADLRIRTTSSTALHISASTSIVLPPPLPPS